MLVRKNPEELNNRLKEWRKVLERKRKRINWDKTEYLEYDFGEREHRIIKERHIMKLSEDELHNTEMFYRKVAVLRTITLKRNFIRQS